jgi:GAF domain-containing protein
MEAAHDGNTRSDLGCWVNDPADFADMSLTLLEEPDVAETLDQIVEYARDCLACDYAGIHIVRSGEIETAAATDEVIRQADKAQAELGEGPCLQAVWDKTTFVVDDTSTDSRWPSFAPIAHQLGLHSILSIRLHTTAQTLGALNFYCTEARKFDDDDVSLAHVFAQHASVALAVAKREEGLRLAIDARHLIGQAQGILMERYGLSADKAFAVLRRYSQDNNVKLRIVAERIIETRRLPDSAANASSRSDAT